MLVSGWSKCSTTVYTWQKTIVFLLCVLSCHVSYLYVRPLVACWLLVVGRPLATLQTGRQLKTEGKQTGHINVRFG